tara:strand:+ start:272 stop:880 length:609 start_codon:yes stop_codon:yes gene_type:complete
MGNIFSNKSFMNRYFSAPKSTGPGKMDPMHNGEPGVQKEDFEQFSGPAKAKLVNVAEKGDMDEVVITPKTRREKKGKKNRLKSFEGETSEQAKQRRGENKQNRKDARKEKTTGKIEKAEAAAVESGKKSGSSDETKRQSNKAKRLEKRSKRQEGRADRKKIRKEGKGTKTETYTKDAKVDHTREVEISKKEAIKASRKKQKA